MRDGNLGLLSTKRNLGGLLDGESTLLLGSVLRPLTNKICQINETITTLFLNAQESC
uniref:Uncharacterized protein n=1 Tax=Arundo donax TaxID=35708 RepID=A0A0A9HJ55_ARUDO